MHYPHLGGGWRDGVVHVEVRNQGRMATSSSSTRLGLSNALERLALQCGPQTGCNTPTIQSRGLARQRCDTKVRPP